jgi:hypothetical protein
MAPQQETVIKNQNGEDNLRDEANLTHRKHRSNKEKTKSSYMRVKVDTLRCPAAAVWNHTTSLIEEVLKEHNHSTRPVGRPNKDPQVQDVGFSSGCWGFWQRCYWPKGEGGLERAGVPEATAR